ARRRADQGVAGERARRVRPAVQPQVGRADAGDGLRRAAHRPLHLRRVPDGGGAALRPARRPLPARQPRPERGPGAPQGPAHPPGGDALLLRRRVPDRRHAGARLSQKRDGYASARWSVTARDASSGSPARMAARMRSWPALSTVVSPSRSTASTAYTRMASRSERMNAAISRLPDASASAQWKAVSCSTNSSADRAASIPSKAAASADVPAPVAAAWVAAQRSIISRVSITSRGSSPVSPRCSLSRPVSAWSGRETSTAPASRPRPTWDVTTPSVSSTRIASRTDDRLTPSSSASCRSAGSRSPAVSPSSAIRRSSWASTSSNVRVRFGRVSGNESSVEGIAVLYGLTILCGPTIPRKEKRARRPLPHLRERHALPRHRQGRRVAAAPAGVRGRLPGRADLLRADARQLRLPAGRRAAGAPLHRGLRRVRGGGGALRGLRRDGPRAVPEAGQTRQPARGGRLPGGAAGPRADRGPAGRAQGRRRGCLLPAPGDLPPDLPLAPRAPPRRPARPAAEPGARAGAGPAPGRGGVLRLRRDVRRQERGRLGRDGRRQG